MLTQEQADWLADQIELDEYRQFKSVPRYLQYILLNLRAGQYTNA